mmetsp:Transcript_61102/g.69976  ORF Transcript_61102/g.69976 Transcript_61102/m.69976 type:complete len:271 (-) Transcript_61102:641-1453(-)
MEKQTRPKVAILGAGFYGLFTAYHMMNKLRDLNPIIHIYEKTEMVGGIAKSHSQFNHIFEDGPRSIALGNPNSRHILQLLKNLNALSEIHLSNPLTTEKAVLTNSKLEPYSKFHQNFKLIQIPSEYPSQDISISSFLTNTLPKHFSQQDKLNFLKNTIEPVYVEKLGAKVSQVSVKSTSPMKYYINDPSKKIQKQLPLLDADVERYFDGIENGRKRSFCLKNGMQDLAVLLEKWCGKCGVDVRLGVDIGRIERVSEGLMKVWDRDAVLGV